MRLAALVIAILGVVVVMLVRLPVVSKAVEITPSPEYYAVYAREAADLRHEYDQKLTQRYQTMQTQAEQAWQERLAQSELDFAAQVAAYEVKLAEVAAKMQGNLTARYEKPILSTKLQLAMVTLTDQERNELTAKLERITAEYATMQDEYATDLEQRYQAFTKAEEQRQKEQLLAWEQEQSVKLTKEYSVYQGQLEHEFEQEIAKLTTSLRRAVNTRE